MSVSNFYDTAVSQSKNIYVTSVTTDSLGNGTWNVELGNTMPSNGDVLAYNGTQAVWSQSPNFKIENSDYLISSPNTYNTGTASQSGTTVTGVGTTFTQSMVGGILIYESGEESVITGYTSATSLTVARTQNISSRDYTIYYGGFQTDTTGNTTANNLYVTGTSNMQSLVLNSSSNQMNINNTTINVNTPSSNRTYTIYDSGQNCNINLGVSKVNSITTTQTVPVSYSGSIITISSQASGQYTITLPAASSSAGINYIFSVSNINNTNDYIIMAQETSLNGYAIMSSGTLSLIKAKSTITIDGTKVQVGDKIIVYCDGTSYNTECISTGTLQTFKIT